MLICLFLFIRFWWSGNCW